VGTGAVFHRAGDQLLRGDHPDVGEVVRNRLRGRSVLLVVRQILEVLRVERAVLGFCAHGPAIAVLGECRRVRCRFARGLEKRVLGLATAVCQSDLLASGASGQILCGRIAALAGEIAGAVPQGLTAVVDVAVVEPRRLLAVVRTDVGFPDQRESGNRVPVGRQVLVDRLEVVLELAQLLFDARKHEHAFVIGVRVADEVDPR